jgi:hypothetical protein
MMLHAKPQQQHEGGCILPSLSNVLHSMVHKSDDGGIDPSQAARWTQMQAQMQVQMQTQMQTQMHQLNAQHLGMWGVSSLLALNSQVQCSQSQSSGHSELSDTASPHSPSDTASMDEKSEASSVSRSKPVGLVGLPGVALVKSRGDAVGGAPVNDCSEGQTPANTSPYWPQRKWRDRRDRKYGCEEGKLQSTHLKVALQGLQAALPITAKNELLDAIRQYLAGDITPEQFAESIKDLVDRHNVVVPTGSVIPAMDCAVRKRPIASDAHEDEAPVAAARHARPRENKRSKNRGSPNSLRANGGGVSTNVASAVGGVKEEVVHNGAWEALVSICSML